MNRIVDRLFLDYGNGKNRKALRLSNVVMPEKEKDALLGFHAFTGNDYVSAFFMKGKTTSWKLMLQNEKFINAFSTFGSTCDIEASVFHTLEEYVCQLYGYKTCSVNLVRSMIYNKKILRNNKAPDISLLPPCHTVLNLHTVRAFYVAKMWRSTKLPWFDLPDIVSYGWDEVGNPIWIEEAFPDDITEILVDNQNAEEDDDHFDDGDDEETDDENEEST